MQECILPCIKNANLPQQIPWFVLFYDQILFLKITLLPLFYGWGSAASRIWSHYEETVYFLPLSSQKFLVLISTTSKRMKGWVDLESTPWFWTRDSPNLSLCINLVIAKYKLKSQYVKLTQLWPLTVNCVKVSSQSYLVGLS